MLPSFFSMTMPSSAARRARSWCSWLLMAQAKEDADAVAKANMKAKGIIAPPVKAAASSQNVVDAAMNEIFGASATPAASPKQPTRTPTRTAAQEQLSEALADVDAASKASFNDLDTKSSSSKVASEARAAMAKAANMVNARAKAGTALRQRAAPKGGVAATKQTQGGVPSAAVWFAKKNKNNPAAKAQMGAVATWRPPRSGNNQNNKAAQAKLLHNAAPNAAPNGNAAVKAAQPAVAAANMTKRKALAKAKALAEAKAVAARRENAGNAGMSALAITAKQQANVNAGWSPNKIERKFERKQQVNAANAVAERADVAMEAANLPKKPLRVDIGGAQGQPAGGKAHTVQQQQQQQKQQQQKQQQQKQQRALAEEQKRANVQLALRSNRTHPDVPETWHEERRERDANAALGDKPKDDPAAFSRRGVMNAKMTDNNKVELSLEDFRELVGAKASASE